MAQSTDYCIFDGASLRKMHMRGEGRDLAAEINSMGQKSAVVIFFH